MNDGKALLAAILENPACDTARLVYADWLDEQGEGRRASLVRRMCSVPKVTYGCRVGNPGDRNADRRGQFALEDWYAELQPLIAAGNCEWDWSRGFVSAITCTQADFLAHARDIFAAHPVERVTLSDREPSPAANFDGFFVWYAHDVPFPDSDNLAPELFAELLELAATKPTWKVVGDRRVRIPTLEETNDALSTVAVRHGRRLAGLPPHAIRAATL